ncbi:tape-measure protein [Streptomyces sp. NPDC002920]
MSTARRTAGGWTADPLVGIRPALQTFRTRLAQSGGTVRSLGERITRATTATDRVRAAADQSGAAVRRTKSNAEAATRSVARTGQTATVAATELKSLGGRTKGPTRSLGRLLTGLGGVVAIVTGLLAAAGPLGDVLGAFGTAMTIGAGVMLIINALTRANPIGFVTGLLLPVAGWLIELALNSETGQRLMEQLATLVLKYVEGYLTILTPVIKAVASAVNTYVTGYLGLVTTALSAVGAVVGTGFAVLNALTTGDTKALSGRVSSVWQGFKDAVRPALTWITQDIPRMFGRIKDAASGTLRAMGQFLTTGAQTVAGVVKGPIQGLVAFANWIIDGLNSLSFSFLGKKFGVHLNKIPMLAEGGVAVPGATRAGGRVLPPSALERQRSLARRHRTTSQLPHRVKEFHESRSAGARGTAEDLLFLASAHACP